MLLNKNNYILNIVSHLNVYNTPSSHTLVAAHLMWKKQKKKRKLVTWESKLYTETYKFKRNRKYKIYGFRLLHKSWLCMRTQGKFIWLWVRWKRDVIGCTIGWVRCDNIAIKCAQVFKNIKPWKGSTVTGLTSKINLQTSKISMTFCPESFNHFSRTQVNSRIFLWL